MCADQVGSLTNLGPLKIPRRRNKAEVPSYVEAYSLPCGENGNPKTPLVLLSLPSGRLYAHEEGRLSVPGKELQTHELHLLLELLCAVHGLARISCREVDETMK